jgi:zinc protease
VKEKELCSGIGAGSGSRIGPSLFTITCSVRPGKSLAETEAAISEEIGRLDVDMITAAELQRVRTATRRNAVSMRESALGRAQSLADSAVLYDDPNRINWFTDKVAAVTPAEVQRVAQKYLRNTNRIVVHTVPGAAPAAPATTR